MTMSHIKLTYFKAKGLGEGTRMMFAYGGQQFEDERISIAEWPTFKTTTPFGQLPLLTINGKLYAQSVAIARYVGRRYGLAGQTDEEAMEIDMNVEFLVDIKNKAVVVYNEEDEALKAKRQEDYVKNVYPEMLSKLHDILLKNKGYIALGKLTWGDFFFAGVYDYIKTILGIPDIDEQYPAFKKLQDTVVSNPKIQHYIKNMPPRERTF